jgi:DNA-binding GntR family transcriptional regulator
MILKCLTHHLKQEVASKKDAPMPRAKTKVYRVVRTNLNVQVYDILKEMIADRRFAPGSSLNVEKLTQELGVSRTPIWEAIRKLEQEGIVIHTPHKGVRLTALTRRMAIELYEVRETMEALAARLGAKRATPEIIAQMEKILAEQKPIVNGKNDVAYSRSDHDFHLLIYQACGNELLKEILEGLRYKALPLAFKLSPHYAEFLEFHKGILQAFRKHDPKAAEKAMKRHNRRMLEIIRKTPWSDEGVEKKP